MAFETGGGGAAGAHGHAVKRDVAGRDALDVDQTKEVFKVGGDAEVDVEAAVAVVDALAAVEGGMGGLEAEFHHPGAEGAGGVVADTAAEIGVVDVVDVGIDGIDFLIGEFGCKGGHDCVGGEEVVGVENTDDVAGGHCDAFVHGVVDAAVGFADVAQTALVERFKFTDDVHCVVCGGAVDYDVFDLCVSLSQH